MDIFKYQTGLIRLISFLFVIIIGVFGTAPAYAANVTATFELDGNVASNGGDDWSTVNASGGSSSILARTGVVTDPAPQSIFTGGGSKDGLDLNGPLSGAGGWKYKDGSVPDKDNITNAYAAAYNVGGDLVIYAGADRFDNSGDAFMGFWFFQNQVGLGSGGAFSGQHAVGDVLVLANFSGGGTTVNIEVLKWVGTGGNVGGTLQRIAGIAGGAPAKCGAVGTSDNYCGITNAAAGEMPPWAYTNKDGTHSFQVADFLELGINITQVFALGGGGAIPCFSSFMAETRSSSSVTATLKDFVLHSFPVCGIAVSKQCKNPLLVNSTTIGYTIEGQVQNTGFGTVTNVALSDNPPAGTFSYYACDASGLPTGSPTGFSGSLNGSASVCYRSSFTSTANGPQDTITATASAGSSTLSATATATCPNLSLSPALSVTKTCSTALDVNQVPGNIVVKVNVSGDVCNTGDAPLSGVTVTDSVVSGNLVNGISLAVAPSGGTSCQSFTASYFPSTAENRLNLGNTTTVPGLAKFSDTVTAKATAPFSVPVTPATFTAHCSLCPTCTPDACPNGICPASVGTSSSTLLRKR